MPARVIDHPCARLIPAPFVKLWRVQPVESYRHAIDFDRVTVANIGDRPDDLPAFTGISRNGDGESEWKNEEEQTHKRIFASREPLSTKLWLYLDASPSSEATLGDCSSCRWSLGFRNIHELRQDFSVILVEKTRNALICYKLGQVPLRQYQI